MLIGRADVAELAARAPTIDAFAAETVKLEQVDVLQVTYEIAARHREDLLPPGLHPLNPPLLTWLFWRCRSSPWGAFAMAQTRLECRSGVRARAFLVAAVVNNEEAAGALAAKWGYLARTGAVALRREGAVVRGSVVCHTREVLDIEVTGLEALGTEDVQYVANMNLAHTPSGLRLVQVEPEVHVQRAERGRPRLDAFDAPAWGDARILPVYPVAASLVTADLELAPVRFVCRPDVLAFEGTERVGRKE